jgi:hypothetical protein
MMSSMPPMRPSSHVTCSALTFSEMSLCQFACGETWRENRMNAAKMR